MFKKVIQLYSFIACITCIALVLISFDKGIRILPQYTMTESRFSDHLEHFEDDESFIEYHQSINPDFIMPSEEISNLRIKERDEFINDKKAKAWEIISIELKWGLIAFAILIIHWYINKSVSLDERPHLKSK